MRSPLDIPGCCQCGFHCTDVYMCVFLSVQHPLWHQLLKDYQTDGCLVEGPLNNLRRNDAALPKPSTKLGNRRNPVSVGDIRNVMFSRKLKLLMIFLRFDDVCIAFVHAQLNFGHFFILSLSLHL